MEASLGREGAGVLGMATSRAINSGRKVQALKVTLRWKKTDHYCNIDPKYIYTSSHVLKKCGINESFPSYPRRVKKKEPVINFLRYQ